MDDFNPVPVAVIDIGVPNVDEQPTSPTEWVDIDPPNEALEEEVVLMGSGSETDPEVCLVKSEGSHRKAILCPALEKREFMSNLGTRQNPNRSTCRQTDNNNVWHISQRKPFASIQNARVLTKNG